jgi:hypothetical protein
VLFKEMGFLKKVSCQFRLCLIYLLLGFYLCYYYLVLVDKLLLLLLLLFGLFVFVTK